MITNSWTSEGPWWWKLRATSNCVGVCVCVDVGVCVWGYVCGGRGGCMHVRGSKDAEASYLQPPLTSASCSAVSHLGSITASGNPSLLLASCDPENTALRSSWTIPLANPFILTTCSAFEPASPADRQFAIALRTEHLAFSYKFIHTYATRVTLLMNS